MLPRVNRLVSSRDFQRVYKKGSFIKGFFFNLAYDSQENTQPVLGVIVSNKVSKSAVIRNKIKRIVRRFFYTKINSIDLGSYVIVARPGVRLGTDSELNSDLVKLFDGIIKK